MIDRFGLLPPPTKTLFRIAELKLRAIPLGVRKIEAGPKGGRLLFNDKPDVDSDKVIRLIREQPQHYKLDGNNRLRFLMDLADPERRINSVQVLLESLARKAAA